MWRLLLLIALLCMSSAPAVATNTPEPPHVENAPPALPKVAPAESEPRMQARTPPKGSSAKVGWLSSLEFWMSATVLAFGLLVFMVEVSVIRSTRFAPDQATKLLAVTLIIVSTLFIITAGFDSEQIAPAMGLFGTVAGYMLGRASEKPPENSP
jgi:MFS family permease